MAEALIECGYAKRVGISNDIGCYFIGVMNGFDQVVNPFIDTIESRRQADALEDWLAQEKTEHWMISEDHYRDNSNHHQWRLDRIKWCFEQMEKDNE